MHADLVGNCTVGSAQETAQAILGINALLHAELPAAHLVSLAVLPKGETWPNRCSDAILTVNAALQVTPLPWNEQKRPYHCPPNCCGLLMRGQPPIHVAGTVLSSIR